MTVVCVGRRIPDVEIGRDESESSRLFTFYCNSVAEERHPLLSLCEKVVSRGCDRSVGTDGLLQLRMMYIQDRNL